MAQLLGYQVIVSVGPRQAAVTEDEGTASYSVERVICGEIDPTGAAANSEPVRAVVEILRQSGGLAPRALIGGIFTPAYGRAMVELAISASDPAADARCNSRLWRPLVSGLPQEFAHSVMGGIVRRARLPVGNLVVDRAGFDPVESSPLAFELAAELLCDVLAAELSGQDVEYVVRSAVEAWP